MKKLVFGLIAVFMLSFSANAQTVEVGVSFTIEIGRNSTGDCSRFGLCTERTKVKVTIKVKDLTLQQARQALNRDGLTEKEFKGIFYYENGKLLMFVDKENYSSIKSYMDSEYFIVEEDHVFRDEIVEGKEYLIKEGKYEFVFDEEKELYMVTF